MKTLVAAVALFASASFAQSPSPPPNPPLVPAAYDGKKIISLAEAELGTFKIPGQDDVRVREYATSTFQNDEVYSQDGWCSAFVAFILKEGGYKFSPNNTDFGWMFVCHRVAEPQPGDIAMLDSHIAFFIGKKVNAEGNHVIGLLGGNQDYQVCIMWVPENDIEYYAEADVAPSGWMPEKHIPNGSVSSINVLDDHNRIRGNMPNPVTSGRSNHPL